MQANNFNSLMNAVFVEDDSDTKKRKAGEKKIVEEMNELSVKNAHDLNKSKHKDFYRSPTADELLEMRQWGINYKKLHKQASKREIRKATQQHFNIRIFK